MMAVDASSPLGWRRVVSIGAAAVALLGFVGCSGSSDPQKVDAGEAPSARSSPFEVGEVPEGFELVTAGAGSQQPTWDSDEIGPTPRFTVLRPATEQRDRIGTVVVSASGYQANQGGLDQAGPGYAEQWRGKNLTVDGREAIYSFDAKGERPRRSALTVVRGDNLQVTVRAEHATQEELEQVSESTDPPPDQQQAPTVTDPPLGLTLVGSVDADAVLAFESFLRPGSGVLPGASTAHVIGWKRGSIDLVALSLPGSSVDLDAVAAWTDGFSRRATRSVARRTIGGRPALVIEERVDDGRGGVTPDRNIVVAEASNGDVLVTTASVGIGIGIGGESEKAELPSSDDLVAMMGSTVPSTDARWDEFVTASNGGPGFHADPGHTELASGERNGIGWLLQDRTGPATNGITAVYRRSGQEPISPDISACLKLDTGDRPCADRSFGTGQEPVTFTSAAATSGIGPFVVVETEAPGERVRIVSSSGTVEAPLVQGVKTDRRAAVLFPDEAGLPRLTCVSPPPAGSWLVSAVAADGTTTCLGPPGQ